MTHLSSTNRRRAIGSDSPLSAVSMLLAALVCLGFAMTGCGTEFDRVRVARAWKHVDLVATRPQVEVRPDWRFWKTPYESRVAFLGRPEGPRRAKNESKQQQRRRRGAGRVMAIEQVAGSALRWPLELGGEPQLSFVATSEAANRCDCDAQVVVRSDDGEETTLWSESVAATGISAPEEVMLDLGRWANSSIDLLFVVESREPTGPALWLSPAVFSRSAVDRAAPSAVRPNVMLITSDTLRADVLGTYGAELSDASPSPALDRFAAESDVWLDAFSTFNITNPSFTSMMTGLYGKNHGIYDLITPLPRSYRTLAEIFSDNGYETFAIVSAAHLADRTSGLGQGFDRMLRPVGQFAAERSVYETIRWLQLDRDAPFFIWLHLFDPHTPHTPPQPFFDGLRPERAPGIARIDRWVPFRPPGPVEYENNGLAGHRYLYPAEVAYMDRQLGRLLSFVESRDLFEDTIVVFSADHGENITEHGLKFRHSGLWDTTTHIPLMIRRPGASAGGSRIEGLVQHIDLFPTILRLADLPVAPSDGVDLYRSTGEGRPGRPNVWAEAPGRSAVMMRTLEAKLMRVSEKRLVPDGEYFYDLIADPTEEQNLAGTGDRREDAMRERIGEWLLDRREVTGARSVELSDEEVERLRGLGYLQ